MYWVDAEVRPVFGAIDDIALENWSVVYFARVKFWYGGYLTERISASIWDKNCVIWLCFL